MKAAERSAVVRAAGFPGMSTGWKTVFFSEMLSRVDVRMARCMDIEERANRSSIEGAFG
jgi:hypothetical protein